MSYAIQISCIRESVVIAFEGDADEAVVARIVTAIDQAPIAASVIIDLNAVLDPRRTATFLLSHIDTGRIGGADVRFVCANLTRSDVVAERLAAREMRLFPNLELATESLDARSGGGHHPASHLDILSDLHR